MYGRRVGVVTLICAMVMFAGCSLPTRGQPLRANTVSVPTALTISAAPTTRPVRVLPPAADPGPIAVAATTRVLPDTSLKPRPKVANAIVSGHARGANGAAIGHVVVGFRKATCPRCAPMTVGTDADGAYTVSVPMDAYLVGCSAPARICSVAGRVDRAGRVIIRSSSTTLDLSVLNLPVRARSRTDRPQQGRGSAVYGEVVYGDARTSQGLPVPRITIELVPLQQPRERLFTDTVADGSYRLAAGEGVFLVACIAPEPGDACGPAGGSGDPYAVKVADVSRHLEFILCRTGDYPACLAR